MQVALEWLENGIPHQGETLDVKKYTLRDMTREAELSRSDAVFILKELQRRDFLKTYILTESKQAQVFTKYLLNFWDWDHSPYIKERLRKKHAIHRRYALEMTGAINKYWIPYFKNKMLGEINQQEIEDFINYLESLQEKALEEHAEWEKTEREQAEKEQAEVEAGLRKPKRKNAAKSKEKVSRFPKSAKRINTIIQAGTVPLTWAFNKEMIDRDVTKGITWFSGKPAERQILSPEQAAAVFKGAWKDDRARLANMLSMVTGMRAGEIQGLRVQDLGKECLYVRHSWNFQDGLKPTKNNESRIVEVPFPSLMQELQDLAHANPHGQGPWPDQGPGHGPGMDRFVFWAKLSPHKPMEQEIFLRDLRAVLVKNGMSTDSARVYTFHGWRHYFTSYMREKVNEKLLQQQTGHKTLVMLEHYSEHKINGDREKIRAAQVETFGSLLPAGA